MLNAGHGREEGTNGQGQELLEVSGTTGSQLFRISGRIKSLVVDRIVESRT